MEAGKKKMKQCDVYVTTFPCILCTKLLIACDVKKIYYREVYAENISKKYFD